MEKKQKTSHCNGELKLGLQKTCAFNCRFWPLVPHGGDIKNVQFPYKTLKFLLLLHSKVGGSVSINLTESCVSSCVTFKQWIFDNLHLKNETNLPSFNETKKIYNYQNFFQYVMLVEWLATFLFVKTIPIQFRDAKVKVKISHLNLAFLQSRLQFLTRIRPKPLKLVLITFTQFIIVS